jgi:hypothetical protein
VTAPLSTPASAGLVFLDDDGEEVVLDEAEADLLMALTNGLEAATVSACPTCRARVLAVVALADLLESGPPHPRSRELIELAEDAPTLHMYVVDTGSACRHQAWRDPGYTEWDDALPDSRHR